jgi:predicted GNAT family acetyltransferase
MPEARALTAADVPEMLSLTALTEPGPFGPRTIELGDYLGVFDAGRLIAMAGERAQAGHFREISGVCTHPEAQGRGWAGRLMRQLIARQLARGQTPFLHVMSGNTGARQLYLRMGFQDHCETVVRVIARR